MATTADAMKILKKRFPHLEDFDERVAVDAINVQVAMLVYQVRKEAGLSQRELADMIGTSQPDISRLEDVDYDGHSLSMLQRIASALNRRIEISMPEAAKPQHA